MNRTLAREIIGCLRVSGPIATSVGRLGAFRRREWKCVLDWLDQSGLALLFWHRLKELGAEGAVPSELGAQLQRSLAAHRLRTGEMAEEFAFLNHCFENAGLTYAALKGFALIPQYCPVACLRTAYDYDYLLPPDAMDRAEQVLGDAGYARSKEQGDHARVYFRKACPPWSPSSRDDLYAASFPRTVEMHHQFWDTEELKIPLRLPQDPLACLESRCLRPAQLDPEGGNLRSLRFYALSEEDELIFQILHAFRHILQNWCRLCSLLDIARLLENRSSDMAFWDRFLERVTVSRPLREIAGAVFSLSAGLFGATVADRVAAETTRTLREPVALWVVRYGQDLALNNFSDNKFSLFLHREFIQDGRTWSDVKRRSLFPLHRPNQAAKTPSERILTRFAANWRQALYVARRLSHHAVAAARYGLESRRWEGLLGSDRRT